MAKKAKRLGSGSFHCYEIEKRGDKIIFDEARQKSFEIFEMPSEIFWLKFQSSFFSVFSSKEKVDIETKSDHINIRSTYSLSSKKRYAPKRRDVGGKAISKRGLTNFKPTYCKILAFKMIIYKLTI